MIKRCSGYGTSFDTQNELCEQCKSRIDCMKECFEQRTRIQEGEQCKALQPKDVLHPIIANILERNNKLNIEIKIDMEWLKKRIGKGLLK